MISHGKDIKVFCGNSNPTLAAEICRQVRRYTALLESADFTKLGN